jgi:carbonic anhydrase
MRLSAVFSGFAATVVFATAAGAATWQPVANAGGERVEIDKGRILRTAEGKTSAWTRLWLGREMKADGVIYDAVVAMNRYDCTARTFATAKRVYMRADKAVREENIAKPKELAIQSGSVDERLLAEACKLRTVGEAQKVAEAAAEAAAQLNQAKPGVMYADVRKAAEEPAPAKTIPVVEAGAPDVKAEAGGEAKQAPRPRFIELPKIDKSQVEDPYAGAKPADAKSAEKAPDKAAKQADKPAEKLPAKAPEKPAVTARPAEKPAAAPADRRELERQYATSGPKRTRVVRSPVEEPAPVVSHGYAHWSYDGEGAPANWAKLRGDYATCGTGRRQSPIDIRDGIRVDLEPIAFDYKLTQFRIVDNGHTIQVNVGEGSTISVMGRTYQLRQFHFHKPGEERVNGRTYDMGVHFVHQDDEGKLAVVAVLLEKGAENSLIQTLWNNMPLEVDQEVAPAVAIDLKTLLPENRAYYTYMGSLTTPPCTEDVLWMVLKQSMPVSPDQVAIFSRLYKNNARPVQPSNGRLIKESR